MPLYDFRCPSCEAAFEAVTEPGDDAVCPACGADDAKRLWRPIAPPARIGLRGYAARKSDDARRARKERKREKPS